MSARKLIVLCGLPRSGKSTWAKASGHPVVNPDAIRLALHGKAFNNAAEPMVWAMAQYMVRSLFLAGHDTVVVDATNTTEKRREMWKASNIDVGPVGEVEVELKVFETSPAVCKERAHIGDRDDLIPVIDRMAAQWDLPKPASWKA